MTKTIWPNTLVDQAHPPMAPAHPCDIGPPAGQFVLPHHKNWHWDMPNRFPSQLVKYQRFGVGPWHPIGRSRHPLASLPPKGKTLPPQRLAPSASYRDTQGLRYISDILFCSGKNKTLLDLGKDCRCLGKLRHKENVAKFRKILGALG